MSKTYHKQTARFIATIADSMPEIPALVMQGWIESPKALRKVLAEVLCPPCETSFPTWTHVTIGNLGDTTTAQERIESAHVKVLSWAMLIIERMKYERTESSLDLALVTVEELGLKPEATRGEIYLAAQLHGLLLCPAEVALQLLLQQSGQINLPDNLFVGMEPVLIQNGNEKRPSIFTFLKLEEGTALSWRNGRHGLPYNEHDSWVFVRRK